jgi:23S rRNA pseudouridine1911/1915/1917 synthase
MSRGTIQRLIEGGHIRVDSQVVKSTHTPRAGEKVSIVWPSARPAQAQPENIPLQVLFEDEDLIVLNKPPETWCIRRRETKAAPW